MTRKHGFTLIELLLVMVIMGILVLIGTGAFVSSLLKGRDTTRKANLRGIASALEMYYNDKGKYPVGVNGGIKGCGTDSVRTVCPAANGAFQDETPTPPTPPTIYMSKLPVDPISGQQYYYVSDALGKQYQIYAHLENTQDPMIITPAAAGTNCGTSTVVPCNYGISSANTSP